MLRRNPQHSGTQSQTAVDISARGMLSRGPHMGNTVHQLIQSLQRTYWLGKEILTIEWKDNKEMMVRIKTCAAKSTGVIDHCVQHIKYF